jgi:hypothetical protein
MRNATSASDAGFILLDALMAVALLTIAGTSIVLVVNDLERRVDGELDRSVALVMSQALMKQVLLVGTDAAAQLEQSDELYEYQVVASADPVPGTIRVRAQAIVARPKHGTRGTDVRLDFLAGSGGDASP